MSVAARECRGLGILGLRRILACRAMPGPGDEQAKIRAPKRKTAASCSETMALAHGIVGFAFDSTLECGVRMVCMKIINNNKAT